MTYQDNGYVSRVGYKQQFALPAAAPGLQDHATLSDVFTVWPLTADGNDSVGTYHLITNNGVTFVAADTSPPANMPGTVARFVKASSTHLSMATPHAELTAQFSISMWYKMVDGEAQHPLANGSLSPNTFGVVFQLNNEDPSDFTYYFPSAPGGFTFSASTNPSVFAVDVWQHIVYTYDGAQGTAADRPKIYIEGSQRATSSATNAPASCYVGDHFSLGDWNGSANFADGDMSSVYIWERTITPDEVTDLYAEGAGLFY